MEYCVHCGEEADGVIECEKCGEQVHEGCLEPHLADDSYEEHNA